MLCCRVTTVEGLAAAGELHPMQAALDTTAGNEGISPAHWPPHTGAEPVTAKTH
jgi:hypothetical protein